ncbi:MAG: hypothetical protein J7575_06720 [Chloroflexi bacterium]|jgi:hypothetical protein|nr:hypothetical protein [Chloroflexota bacterium]
MDNTRMVRRHPVILFYLLAFLFSWLGWGPQALHERGLLPFSPPLLGLLGGVGPTLAAVVGVTAVVAVAIVLVYGPRRFAHPSPEVTGASG